MKITRQAARKTNALLSFLFGVRIVRVRQVADDSYDKRHEQLALKAICTIERHNGQNLSQRVRKLADDYAVQILGGKEYAPWLYVYALVSGTFKEGWMPDNFFGKIVMPRVNKDLRFLTYFKTFSNVVLKTTALPDVAYYIDGILYGRNLKAIDMTCFGRNISETNTEMFVKKDGSSRGEGVIRLAVKDINEDRFKSIGNCVIQTPILQHDFFERIISGSVATLRVTTVKENNGRIDLRASYLRLGRADTAWVQSDNSVRVAIIDRNGELDSFGYTQDWRRWPSHPDTNFVFSEQRVPLFEEAVQTCIKLHSSVPHFTIIGWDIAISKDETIYLLEWNGDHCDIKFSEATAGPCFLGLNWDRMKQ